MHRSKAFTLAAIAALAACSGGNSGHETTPEVTVSPAEATVAAGGAPVQLTATAADPGATIAWSLETPGDASDVGTISGTGLYTPPAALAVARDVVVRATAGDHFARATVHVTPLAGPFTISGKVVDGVGRPYPGARVVAGGRSTTAAADGSFTLSGVAAPYDATIVVESSTKVARFLGVTDLTPVLWIWSGFSGYRSAWVKGIVTLDGAPTFAEVYGPWASTYAFNEAGYELNSLWFGDETTIATHRASWVGYDAATGMPAAYWHGQRDVALTHLATITGQDIAMAALPAGPATGTTDPGDAVDPSTLLFTGTPHFEDGGANTLFERTGLDAPVGPFALAVPALPDGTLRLGLGGQGWEGGTANASAPVVPGQSGITLALPAIPAAWAPAAGATSAGGSTFTWTAGEAGGTNAVSFSCGAVPIVIYVYGTGTSATIPSVSGVTIPPGTSCTWTPRWYSYSIDELVRGPKGVGALPVTRHGYGAPRAFTY